MCPLLELSVLVIAGAAAGQSTVFKVNSNPSSFNPFAHAFEGAVGSGHASLTLRHDWGDYLYRASKELGVKRTRFHGLLDDDFSVSLGPTSDSYYNIDSMVDYHIEVDMEPLFEVSFMPSWLASNSSETTMHYKGITSPPTNYSAWGAMVGRLGTHLAERYPDHAFMFEIWNEPNGGFWTPVNSSEEGKKAEYFKLYKEAATALRAASPKFQIGGPATAGCPGWTSDLVAFTGNNSLPLDFVSCHVYGGGSDEQNVGSVPSVLNPLKKTQEQAQGRPVVITEWSSSWMYTVDYHDLPASAPFIVEVVAGMDGLVNISSYWTFCDVFEEGGMLPSPFHGGFGLMTVSGTPKPAYRAFQLLHGTGNYRVPAPQSFVETGDACNGTGILATANDTHFRFLIYNHPSISSDPGSTCSVTVDLDFSPKEGDAVLCHIDDNNTNPRQAWVSMGSPVYLNASQLAALETASELIWKPAVFTDTSIQLELLANALVTMDVRRHN